MNILEKRSAIRVKALKNLVDKGEYPVEYAIGKLDDLNIKGLITATDYEETFNYFEELMNKEEIAENDTYALTDKALVADNAEDNAEDTEENTSTDETEVAE